MAREKDDPAYYVECFLHFKPRFTLAHQGEGSRRDAKLPLDPNTAASPPSSR